MKTNGCQPHDSQEHFKPWSKNLHAFVRCWAFLSDFFSYLLQNLMWEHWECIYFSPIGRFQCDDEYQACNQEGEAPPPLEKCVEHRSNLLDIVQKIWTPIRKLFATPGVPHLVTDLVNAVIVWGFSLFCSSFSADCFSQLTPLLCSLL